MKYKDNAKSSWVREPPHSVEMQFETEQGIVVSDLNFLAWKP